MKAIVFDVYTTLIDISTDEEDWHVYDNLAKFLSYRGVYLSADEVRWFYFEKIAKQLKDSKEQYPEIDVRRIWYEILSASENKDVYNLKLNKSTFVKDVVVLHRALSRKRIRLYPRVFEALTWLKRSFRLGVVSDAQRCIVLPELKIFGIHDMFDAIVVSSDYGFRKPDGRLFLSCLKKLGVSPEEAVFVGNDTFRDIQGANSVGMGSVLVMTEYGNKDQGVAKPTFVVNSVAELPGILRSVESKS